MGTRIIRVWQFGRIWIVLTFMVCARAVGHQSTDPDPKRLIAPDIYSEGPLKVELFGVFSAALSGSGRHHLRSKGNVVEVKLNQDPPRPLLIAAPNTAGSYPVALFQHGFSMKNSYYSQIISHIASHGFIVVAPQMYIYAGSDATDEIVTAGAVVDWFPAGLESALAQRLQSVKADLKRIAIVGHSRGAKVVFGLATGICNTSLKISALVGLDPVDGTGLGHQTNPPILKFKQHSLGLKIPTLIVGAALGSVGKFLFPACAPAGISHQAFFFDSAAPTFHFVAPEYGHMDYMDDECPGAQGWASYCVCKNGPAREPMRKFSAGIVVAFLQAALLQDSSQLSKAIFNPGLAPVKLEAPEFCGNLGDVTSYVREIK